MAKKNTKRIQRGRTKKRLTPTTKRIMSMASAEHLDGYSEKHMEDIVKQREFAIKHFSTLRIDGISEQQLLDALEEVGFVPPDPTEYVARTDLEEIKDFRDNICFVDGRWIPLEGKEWLEFVKNHQKAREEYKVSGGNTRRIDDDVRIEIRTDKKTGETTEVKHREYQNPLLSTFVRMPPWLAMELDVEKDEKLVKEVITRFAEYYAKQTGMDVLAVNIHRESSHDLHIHLVYSDVIKHTKVKKVSVRERREMVKPLREAAKTEMKQKGLPTQLKHVKQYMDDHGFTDQVPEFQDIVEYRKIIQDGSKPRKDDWPVARRSLKTLGTAYRHKAWLHQSASGEDKKAVAEFREIERQGNFSDQFLSLEDPKADYLDWWAENELFDRLLSGLSPERQKKVKVNAGKAVEQYLKYGKSVLDPAEIALADEKSASAAEREKLEEDKSKLEVDKTGVAKDKAAAIALGKDANSKLSEADQRLKKAEAIESSNYKAKQELATARESLARSRKTTARKIRSARNKFRSQRLDAVTRLIGFNLTRKPMEDGKAYRLRIRNVTNAKLKALASLNKAGKTIGSTGDLRKTLPKEVLQVKEVRELLTLFAKIKGLLGIEDAPGKGKNPGR